MKKLSIALALCGLILAGIIAYAITAELPAPSQPVEKALPNDKYIQ